MFAALPDLAGLLKISLLSDPVELGTVERADCRRLRRVRGGDFGLAVRVVDSERKE